MTFCGVPKGSKLRMKNVPWHASLRAFVDIEENRNTNQRDRLHACDGYREDFRFNVGRPAAC